MSKLTRLHILVASGAIAIAAGGALMTPAGAASMQPLLQAFAATSCSSSSPCQEYDNTAGGSGLKGTSSKGTGLIGVTHYNKANATTGTAGVSGTDTATQTTKNSGVLGVSNVGAGVTGTSNSSSGVSGLSAGSFGVSGVGNEGGVFGQVTGVNSGGYAQGGLEGVDATNTDVNAGLLGVSSNGTGAVAESINGTGLYASGFYGEQVNGYDGIQIGSTATGLFVESSIGYGIEVDQLSGNTSVPLFTTSGVAGNPAADAYEAFDSNGTLLAKITDTGDMSILGLLYTSGVCSSGCITQHDHARRVVSYAPTEAEPIREDTGIAQLVGGKAFVRLDPAFVNVIDTQRSYAVLLTPEGDSHGLYVASKSREGFEVRENMGGTSTLSFDYRVVAKPYGVNAARLPMVTLPAAPRPRPTHAPIPRVHH